MITEELETRGISFSGYYNHNPSYYDRCDIEHSHLYMTGNCLNNSTKYCVNTVLFWIIQLFIMYQVFQ